MFGRQWFRPGSQVALEEDAAVFESLLRRRQYNKAIDLANEIIVSLSAGNTSYNFWLRQRLRVLKLKERKAGDSTISVVFTGFWPGFRQDDNELYSMLKHVGALIGSEIVIDTYCPDLLIFSCFGEPEFNKYPSSTRILYLGENVRPDFSATDYCLSFDISDYCGRNIYLPLWLLRSAKYASSTSGYQPYNPLHLDQPRDVNGVSESIVYIGNNNTPIRMEAIKELKRLGMRVECYGSHTNPVQDKIKTLNGFRYSLCFENSYTPGYVTEKIIDAFIGGTIPIYWGGIQQNIFNLDRIFVCDPHNTISVNMINFLQWKQNNHISMMPPLLQPGAFAKIDSAVIVRLSKLLMDLF